jgi:hypothetical protein
VFQAAWIFEQPWLWPGAGTGLIGGAGGLGVSATGREVGRPEHIVLIGSVQSTKRRNALARFGQACVDECTGVPGQERAPPPSSKARHDELIRLSSMVPPSPSLVRSVQSLPPLPSNNVVCNSVTPLYHEALNIGK